MKCTNHIEHYRIDAELFDYFDEGGGATRDFDRRLRSHVLRLCGAKKGDRVLDIGSGSGWIARELASKGVHTVSVDLSMKNLLLIREGLSDKLADFVFADAYHLPFREASFDVVIASEVFEHLELPAHSLREVRRILAPGAKVVVSTPYKERIQYYLCIHCNKRTPANAHLHSFDEHSLSSLLRDQSFDRMRFYKLGNKFFLYTRLYYLLQFIPFAFWRLLDRVANLLIPKPAHITAVARRN